jgi:endonuclease III
MTTTVNKQRVLTQLFAALKKRPEVADQEARPVLEQLVYGICRENATREQADAAYQNLRGQFYDWNEVRVSSPHEVEESLRDLSESERRAERIISLLQEVFEATFSFDLESMHKKGVKQAVKSLARYQAVSEFTSSWVVQQALGGHAVPLDTMTVRVIKRLGLIDREQEDLETMRTSLEHLVPKAKGSQFTELVSWIGSEFCWENEPNCSSCSLASECPTGQESAATEMAATRSTRSKPR